MEKIIELLTKRKKKKKKEKEKEKKKLLIIQSCKKLKQQCGKLQREVHVKDKDSFCTVYIVIIAFFSFLVYSTDVMCFKQKKTIYSSSCSSSL